MSQTSRWLKTPVCCLQCLGKGVKMKELRTEIEIQASAEKVWQD